MPDNALYERVKSELNRIYGDVRALRTNQHVFWEVQRMIHENPNLRKPSTFYGWMGQMYVGTMTATIRRLIDTRRDTVSFVRLLEQIKADLSCFSRAAYKSRCTNQHLPDGYVDADYDSLVGKGKQQPDKQKIDDDISELKRRTEILKIFVDERIAHSAVEQEQELPKFQDLDDAIDYLEEILKWYNHLITGAVVSNLLPSWLYDWKEIFHYPWIQDIADNEVSSSTVPSTGLASGCS